MDERTFVENHQWVVKELNPSPSASPLDGNGFTGRREEHHGVQVSRSRGRMIPTAQGRPESATLPFAVIHWPTSPTTSPGIRITAAASRTPIPWSGVRFLRTQAQATDEIIGTLARQISKQANEESRSLTGRDPRDPPAGAR